MDCKQAGIDLHIHSHASDGTFSPPDILRHAQEIGLKAVSITDHDTVSGVIEAEHAGIPDSLAFLPGVEMSADLPAGLGLSGSCHILGYGISPGNPRLKKALADLQEARKYRNPQIIDKLHALNISITLEEVSADAGGQQIGRPHIAQTLVRKRIVASVDKAFDKYLSRGRPAYVEKYRIESVDAIDVIRNSGGIPVLAHPFLLDTGDFPVLEGLVTGLAHMGLMGIEVYYPGHSPEVMEKLGGLAERLDLLVTGGTDFHGTLTPGIHMGSGKGDLFIPYRLYEKLVCALKRLNSGQGPETP